MILGIPVVEGHELTEVAVRHIRDNRQYDSTKVVIIDNGSAKPYQQKDTGLIRYEDNKGFYYPLIDLYNTYPDEEYIGIMHNDLMLYENGFDKRMMDAFAADPKLGLIGLCGSREVDERGGRGGYTVCNFMGLDVKVGEQTWKGQDPSAGARADGLTPAIVLDSLFMLFRRDVIPHLMNDRDPWEDITLAHFYDRIWPIRTIEAGYRVAVLGSDCDHIGGLTTTANERYRDDCIKFLDKRGIAWRDDDSGVIAAERSDERNIPCGNPETQMYLVAEDRYLKEYRDEKKFLPAIILDGGTGYDIRHTAL